MIKFDLKSINRPLGELANGLQRNQTNLIFIGAINQKSVFSCHKDQFELGTYDLKPITRPLGESARPTRFTSQPNEFNVQPNHEPKLSKQSIQISFKVRLSSLG